jgi:hypothetical protein
LPEVYVAQSFNEKKRRLWVDVKLGPLPSPPLKNKVKSSENAPYILQISYIVVWDV